MTINVHLPDGMKAFVDAQVAAGGYTGPSEYVQALIRQALEADERRELEARLLVGVEELERGDSQEMTKDEWARIKREYLARHAK
jgi:antitoxin ParD1/3/4